MVTNYPENVITIVLNFTESDFKTSSFYQYVSLSEIQKTTQIDSAVNTFFQQNPYLTKIYNVHLEEVPIPKTYYLCKEENGEFVNVAKSTDIIPRTFIKGKGNFFLFSETPILTDETRDLAKFAVLFDENGENVLKEDSGFFSSLKPFEEKYAFHLFTQNSRKFVFLKSLENIVEL